MGAYSLNRTNVKSFITPIVAAAALLVGCERGSEQGPTGPDRLRHEPTGPTLVQSGGPNDGPITVVPFEFDPFGTNLVRSFWLTGTGCPTGATVNDGTTAMPFTDDACMTGDPKDKRNEGLLLVKTGPTPNFASAGADLKGVKGITLTELGYDIRSGSHCGGGAPRFNVVTADGVLHFIGCNSPPAATVTAASPGWKRLRWTGAQLGPAAGSVVRSITIIFDEGQDTPSAGPPGPETGSGIAVLDNIDVNETLVGKGPGN